MKLRKAIYIKHGVFEPSVDRIKVRIMAIAEGYAMVRRKGAMPFVCNVKDLEYDENLTPEDS